MAESGIPNPRIERIAEDMLADEGSYVFVVGAGGSASVGCPVSSELKKDLTDGWREEMKVKLDELASEMKGALPYHTPDDAPLEVLLPIYADIVQGKKGGRDIIERFLRGKLKSYADGAVFPPVGYEILAHLANNGLVRHIISMNFDELLEQTLDEELGERNYQKVTSTPTFARVRDDIEERRDAVAEVLKGVFLFKPHGTLSLSATLKPTLDEVVDLDMDKYEVLRYVISDRNVVFVGYSFLDPGIQKLFVPIADEGKVKKVFFVDPDADLSRRNKKVEALLFKTHGEGGLIPMASDDFFIQLAAAISRDQKKGKWYPATTRHVIRNCIFDAKGLAVSPIPRNKLVVELVIFALKVKGKFTTKALLTCERVKYYTARIASGEKPTRDRPDKLQSARTILQELCDEEILTVIRKNQ